MSKSNQALLAGFVAALVVSALVSVFLISQDAGDGASGFVLPAILGAVAGIGVWSRFGNRPIAAADATARHMAETLTPPEGQALLVVVRKRELTAAFIGMDIRCDGRVVTQLAGGSFATLPVEPGPHTLSAKFAGPTGKGIESLEMAFDVAAGATAAFEIATRMRATSSEIVLTPFEDLGRLKQVLAKLQMREAA